jgi:hypothetical protein
VLWSGGVSAQPQLTAGELDLVREQIARCWNINAGARDAKDLVIEIRVALNRDGTATRADIVDTGRANSDPLFRAAAESARWVFFNPNCTPLKLPPEKYETWKDFVVDFSNSKDESSRAPPAAAAYAPSAASAPTPQRPSLANAQEATRQECLRLGGTMNTSGECVLQQAAPAPAAMPPFGSLPAQQQLDTEQEITRLENEEYQKCLWEQTSKGRDSLNTRAVEWCNANAAGFKKYFLAIRAAQFRLNLSLPSAEALRKSCYAGYLQRCRNLNSCDRGTAQELAEALGMRSHTLRLGETDPVTSFIASWKEGMGHIQGELDRQRDTGGKSAPGTEAGCVLELEVLFFRDQIAVLEEMRAQ